MTSWNIAVDQFPSNRGDQVHLFLWQAIITVAKERILKHPAHLN